MECGYVRLHLAATRLGLSLQPMSQLLEEYPEMEAQRRALYEALGFEARSATLQMLARVGYGERVPPAPRRELASLLRPSG